MKQEVLSGQADYTVLVYIPDPASTDGSGKTGLVAANLTVSYTRVETDNDVVVTDATGSLNDLAALTSAHADWGLKEVSNTLAPGLYRLDIADAVFASGAWSAVVYVMITTSAAAASPMEFVMVPYLPLTGNPDIAAIKAKTDNLPSDPADESLIIAATDALATLIGDVPTNAELATALAAADDAVLAQVALVKAKTDSLTYTVAGVVDANVQRINDVEITGDGSGTPFGV